MAEGPWPGKAYQDAIEHARRRSASQPLNYGWTRPQVVSQGPVWPGGGEGTHPSASVVGQEIQLDSPIILEEGEVLLDGAIPMDVQPSNTAPLPTPTPASQGSSSRNTLPDPGIRQVSYAAPVPSTATIAAQETSAAKPAMRSNNGTRPLKMKADSGAQRLPRNSSKASRQSSNTRVQAKMDWEKFGLTRPAQRDLRTRATIKPQKP